MNASDGLLGPIIFKNEPEDSVGELLDDAIIEEPAGQADLNEGRLVDNGNRDVAVRKQPQLYLEWSSPSRQFDAKSPQWFLGMFAVALIVVIFLAAIREVWLALFVVSAVFVFYAMARVKPADVEHRILSSGIETADRMYEWKDLRSFWLYERKGVVVLRLDTRLYFPHVLELLLPDETPEEDVEELVELLVEYIPLQEKPHSEAGEMADAALLSVSNKLPGQQRMLRWLGNNLGIK